MGTDTLVMYPKTAQYYLDTIRAIHRELDSTFDNKSTLNIKGLAATSMQNELPTCKHM